MIIPTSRLWQLPKSTRQSNMELLRIVAMAMVLVVHADFVSLGTPPKVFAEPYAGLTSVLRTVFEMAALVCVNLFVLISGWFSIRPTVRGGVNLMFQVLFFMFLTYFVMILFGKATFSADGVAGCFCLKESGWFIKAYAGLFLVAPLLNLFCEHATERRLRLTIVLFYCYQTLWGFIGCNTSVADGYSVFSFMGLYLLARYMHLYYRGCRRRSWAVLYGLTVALNVVAYYFFPTGVQVVSYANPLVVLGALGLMMYFSGLKMRHSDAVNFVAASCFGVYLLHTSPAVMSHYIASVKAAYASCDGVLALFATGGVVVAFFVLAVAVDQLRICLWNRCGMKMSATAGRWLEIIASRDFLRRR